MATNTTSSATMKPHTVVKTGPGLLCGKEENGVIAFHGVPYAQPPVGPRRFRSPIPVIPWTGVLDATESRGASYQTNDSNREKVRKIAAKLDLGAAGIPPRPDYSEATYSQQNASEDCLYLEIWVPEIVRGDNTRLPVFLYYHGGANASSSGHNRYEDGGNLCREENIIVIRPTYREGFLGWAHFGLISDQFPEAINLGLQDQIAALRWVHENIESFGGDKHNITVAGESAGATAVSGLMTYPPTQALMRRAIIQSLSPFHAWCTQERQDAITVAEMILQLLEIDDPAKLAELDPDYFLAAHLVLVKYFHPDRNCAWSPVGPVVDGKYVPKLPLKYLCEAKFPRRWDFEIMLGFAKDEWQYSRGQSNTIRCGTEAQVKDVIAQVFGPEGAEQIYRDFCAAGYPNASPGHTLGDIMSFEFFKFGELAIARNFAKQGIRTHVFQFSLDLPGYGGILRAVHTGDMPIIFRNLTDDVLQHFPGFDGVDRSELARISAEFGTMYAGFVRDGNPGSKWPTYDLSDTTVLWLGETVCAKPGLLDQEWKAFSRAGVTDIASLQYRLVNNTRRALNKRKRAFATDNGLWTRCDRC